MSAQHEALEQATTLELWARDYATTDYTDEMANRSAALIRRQHTLIVQMSEWAESYLDAQGALDNRELLGQNAPPHWELQAKCNRNREALDDALTAAHEYLKE